MARRMTDEEYLAFKKFLGLYYDWFKAHPGDSPDAHPVKIVEQREKQSHVQAMSDMEDALNNVAEDTIYWGPQKISLLDQLFIEHGAPSLSSVQRMYSDDCKKILHQGGIKNLDEYYIVQGVLDRGGNDLEDDEGLQLQHMLDDYAHDYIKRRSYHS